MSDVIFERIEFFSIKFQKSAISRLNSISKRSSFSRFSNSFSICILWIRSSFKHAFFVNSKNLKMRNSTNWFVKSLKYFFFLMMFFFHVTSSSDLKSFETQISLNFIFWSLRLYAMNIFVEFVERKNWTKVIKSFFLKSLNSLFCTDFIVDWNIRNSFLIRSCFLILTISIFVDWDKEKTFLSKKNLFFLFSIDFLEKTTWSNFHFELNKILFALTISDERILTKQASDLNWTLSRDFLATVLIKILFALTINDERIFIKSNSNSAFVWSNCEQSANLDVFSLKRRFLNLKNRFRQKTRLFLFDLQNRVDRKL
jgi:hypothetical protein